MEPLAGCPPGLEYLTQLDQLLIAQSVELLEAFTAYEGADKFVVRNSMGQLVYYATEESGFCARQCCGNHRGFVVHVIDTNGQEVMRATRHFKCFARCQWCACLNCCSYEIMVESPPGTLIGSTSQNCSVWKPSFDVKDAGGDTTLRLAGPWCMYTCPCFDIDFKVETPGGKEVGKVSKQWSGLAKEVFTKADNFGVTFPLNLDVRTKATLLGSVFLINMMYFEKDK